LLYGLIIAKQRKKRKESKIKTDKTTKISAFAIDFSVIMLYYEAVNENKSKQNK